MEEVLQLLGDLLRDGRQAHNNHTQTANGPLGNVGVDICHVFAKLVHDLLDVCFTSDLPKDLQFNVLDVGGLVVLYEELLEFVLKENITTAQHQKLNMR